MKQILASILLVLMLMMSIGGCAGGKFTVGGASTANTVVDYGVVLAKAVLAGLDVFYPVLLANQAVPVMMVKATQGLQLADKAAALLHKIINANVVGDQAKSAIEEAQNYITQALEISKSLDAFKLAAANNEVKTMNMKMQLSK